MLIVQSYPLAVTMCIVTMLCWGSWANTQKLASKEWRFQLFYWDYAVGVLLLALALAFTLGSTGSGGRPFLADLRQAEGKWLGSAVLGGVIFNLSNILLVAAIDIAGLAVAFPVGVGLALVLGVVTTYLVTPTGNVPMLALGVGSIVIAILLDALAYRRLAGGGRKAPVQGIVLSVAAGLLMGWFYSFVAQSMGRIDPSSQALEAGKLSPYTAIVVFSAGLLASNFLWNTIMMIRPLSGEPVPLGDYFTKGSLRLHAIGILGGVIWNLGMSFSIIAAGTAGAALSYGLGQGATDGRRVLGRVHLEGVPRRAAGHQQTPRGHVRLLLARARHPDRLQALTIAEGILMAKKPIVVVGSSNTDMIIKLDRIPRPGETVLGGQFMTAPGGKGANQAVAAARAGGRVAFIARVGRDMFGDQAVAGFVKDRIDVEHVVRDKASPSGVALIFVAADGENSIAVASGANGLLSPADVKKARKTIASAAALVMQLETPLPTVQAAAEIAARAGVRVILNPAPAQPLPDELLRLVSVLTPNETEAELLTGVKVDDETSAGQAADRLLTRGVQTVIITLGPRGAFVATDGLRKLIDGFPVQAVDTTAAGDVFNGALAVALAEGQTLEQAVRFANAAAAISVTRMGAQPSAPKRKKIDKLVGSS